MSLTDKEKDARYLALMQRAAQSLESATLQVRLFRALFSDDVCELRASVPDTAAAAGMVRKLLVSACDDLFSGYGNDAGAKVGNDALDKLWGCVSIATLCHETLQAGRFGDGEHLTTFPVLHAMDAALDRLLALRRPLDRYLANLPKPAKVKAAA